MFKTIVTSTLSVIVALVLLHACGSEAVNEPGEDIQSPVVVILEPLPDDTLQGDAMTVKMQATDNLGVVRIEVFVNSTSNPWKVLTAEPWETVLDMISLDDGNHAVIAVAYDAAGNESVPSISTFIKGESHVEVVKRMVLAEIVTSANCAPCGPQNETYHHGTASPLYDTRLATIKYHVWWPRPTDDLWLASQTWSQPRTEYLFSPLGPAQYSAPNGWVAGEMIGSSATDWIAAVNQDMTKIAKAKITLHIIDEGTSVDLNIQIKGIMTAGFNDLRLHTVVTESEIEYNDGNSENIHYDVMRRMYPDAGGEAVNILNGQEESYHRLIAIEPEWEKAHIKIVVFLQSNSSKEILQTAKINLLY